MIGFKKDIAKTIVFAFIVSIVVIAAIFEIKKFQIEEETEEAENRVVPFGSNEIFRVEFNEFILERDGEKFTWKLVSPITDYLNYSAVETWVSKGLSQEGRDLSDGGEALNWSEFSLDHNDHKIVYTTESGAKSSVQLSKKEAFDGSAYLKVSMNNLEKLYSSSTDWKDVFAKKVEDLRSLQIFNWEVPSPSSNLKKISFYKKGKKYLSLEKSGKWKSENFNEWTFDDAKVDSYLMDLKTHLHEGFTEGVTKDKVNLRTKTATIVVNTDTNEEYSMSFHKGEYAISNYRPEHIVKTSKESEKILMVNPLDLRSFKDADGGFPNGEFDHVKIKINEKSKAYSLKENTWVLDAKGGTGDQKKKKNFESVRMFLFLDQIKRINYKRFVSDKAVVFKSAKKRIYLSKEGLEIVRYSIGPDFPCTEQSRAKRCVIVATNMVKDAYLVASKSEINKLFKFSFNKEAN